MPPGPARNPGAPDRCLQGRSKSEALAERLWRAIQQVQEPYHRLVLVVGPAGSGKTGALRLVAEGHGLPLMNGNLELSRRMLEVTGSQRARQGGKLLEQICREVQTGHEGKPLLLDNLELLFDPDLHLDPLWLLRRLSRHRTLAAPWTGRIAGKRLT